jgi:acyl-CoA synthetase (NDP forming)
VNPHAVEVQGVTAYPRLTAVPAAVDLAVIAVPAAQVEEAVADCIAKRVKAVVVITAGYSEIGPEGRAREARLLASVRAAGMRMVGPNCMGLLNTDPNVRLNATFSPVFPPRGRVAFSTQSGALGLAILEYARRIDLGLSTFVSIGNKADVSSNDLLQFWEDDPGTDVILLYLESFGNPRKFGELARRIGRRKPIVAVKAGRSKMGARAASSHTGALAASDQIVSALFAQAGVIRTGTIEEMFDVAALLARQPLPQGRRVAVLTNAGGPGILAADACEAQGLEIAALSDHTRTELGAFLPAAAGLMNPVDMLATATANDYGRAMRALVADPAVDSVICIFIPPIVTAAADVATHIRDAVADSAKPVLATFIGVEGATPLVAPIPCYRFPESAVNALARAVEYSAWRGKVPGQMPDFSAAVSRARAVIEHALERGEGWLTPVEAQTVVESLGIGVLRTRIATSEDDAVREAAALGFPVALKGFGPDIVHKSDVGAVKLGLMDADHVSTAYRDLATRLGNRLSGVQLQSMAPEGIEMFVGGLQDPNFGPVVFCGSGGVLLELIGDAVCRLCPVSDRDVDEMLASLPAARRLRGYRGRPPADEGALREALLSVSALLGACPEIQEMDINPLTVFERGACALDVRIRIGPRPSPQSTRHVQY